MTNQISSKVTALAAALMLNGLMLGGVAFLFDGQLHQPAAVVAVASTATGSAGAAV